MTRDPKDEDSRPSRKARARAVRRGRLAAALRANLRRRKGQVRARAAHSPADGAGRGGGDGRPDSAN